ncbi:hypothetical protein F5Y11DRAFT_205399 [Daldinia sp. FL1419]|nr:hypothetical protein F5Y11DRAFT_205399 [Daldinia sp. FL1419]
MPIDIYTYIYVLTFRNKYLAVIPFESRPPFKKGKKKKVLATEHKSYIYLLGTLHIVRASYMIYDAHFSAICVMCNTFGTWMQPSGLRQHILPRYIASGRVSPYTVLHPSRFERTFPCSSLGPEISKKRSLERKPVQGCCCCVSAGLPMAYGPCHANSSSCDVEKCITHRQMPLLGPPSPLFPPGVDDHYGSTYVFLRRPKIFCDLIVQFIARVAFFFLFF